MSYTKILPGTCPELPNSPHVMFCAFTRLASQVFQRNQSCNGTLSRRPTHKYNESDCHVHTSMRMTACSAIDGYD